ncbi:hypothetical protein C4K22_1355 [Pseudomonas chlororaphis subsp. aurantiaca]|nr:hypothetical protein C4K24_1337 [Pseudomonas chlororaphis subsp. aurantiaca]AZD97266.1 hypothetical protein C4K12_1383 [Pseudomonas chlororaphis subsp. aureofaciens]AZD34115.1 hypothetical protein C4K22_1355 [Pseudomonas chlororaphis subsp. aurantiaca]AZD40449.1 hypothetical protein C4K21_1358 [Pseudomonas chlororaphis subsp. aurantiaca]AZD46774.1 hypothetical protein C4K20_1342 [Pseudomonas chlororaphis subsp. aurantiaca]
MLVKYGGPPPLIALDTCRSLVSRRVTPHYWQTRKGRSRAIYI